MNSGRKIKRPTSCSNKKTEKIFYTDKNNIHKVMKFANQGKKIYLKTNKTSINTEKITNININLNEKLNNSDNCKEKNNNENIINLTNKNTPNNIAPYNVISQSGNIITDIFFVRNLGDKNLKAKIKYNNLYDEKEGKQKRFPSAMNAKLLVKNNKILL